ncbi:hypothetical protein GQ44DRAFT_760914 [Phaeosphaeriaceae sp. PMI808]|nr:hypothetical protein GQ44DRAFT_760914 [Phaeosphaeriaceae sp. PMI808]
MNKTGQDCRHVSTYPRASREYVCLGKMSWTYWSKFRGRGFETDLRGMCVCAECRGDKSRNILVAGKSKQKSCRRDELDCSLKKKKRDEEEEEEKKKKKKKERTGAAPLLVARCLLLWLLWLLCC